MFCWYTFLLCLTYYILTVNSVNKLSDSVEKEFTILWDTIRGDSDFINEETFLSFYKNEDPNELLRVIRENGHESSLDRQNRTEHVMNFQEFMAAATEGLIQICSTQAMNTVFNEIMANQNDRNFTIYDDLTEYYGPVISESQLAFSMFGRPQLSIGFNDGRGRPQLIFSEFKKSMNEGDIPKPIRDEIAFQTEMEHLFNEIKTSNDVDYVTYDNLCCYYEGHDSRAFRKTMEKHGTEHKRDNDHKKEYRMKIDTFKEIGYEGLVPRYSVKLMKNEFKKIIPENQHREYVTYEELTKYYEKKIPLSQLEDILSDYGDHHDDQYRLDFDEFCKAMNNGHFPGPLSDKTAAIHNLFKDIIPKTENRNHILVNDLINYYGTKKYPKSKLRRLFKRHGKFSLEYGAPVGDDESLRREWNGGQYLVYFPSFKRILNFGHLEVPE